MELQERALRAPVSVSGDEGALIAVPLADGALNVPRKISRRDDGCSQLPIRPGTDRARRPRLLCRPPLGSLYLLQEQGEGAVEDGARVAVRDLATEKSLNAPKLLVALLADRELDAIALRRGGLDDRTSCRNDRRWGERWRSERWRRFGGRNDRGLDTCRRGRGANSATRASISRRLRPQALARTASWFAGVRCRLSSRTAVSDSAPEARWSRITGKPRQARAASIRLQAASSESRSTFVQ